MELDNFINDLKNEKSRTELLSVNDKSQIIKILQEKYADAYSKNQSIKNESVKRNERIKTIETEIESWKNLLSNSEKMVNELTERKNKLSKQLNDLENQPRVQAERKGQISENLRISEASAERSPDPTSADGGSIASASSDGTFVSTPFFISFPKASISTFGTEVHIPSKIPSKSESGIRGSRGPRAPINSNDILSTSPSLRARSVAAVSQPSGRRSPSESSFTGFVFKIQANMDPKHRDRVAFIRVCSGKFEKDMSVKHSRTGKTIRLSRPQKIFGQDREVVDDAYPGDVIGLNNPGMFSIGDTLYTGAHLEYEGIPSFSPEIFSWLRNPNPSAFKNFRKGVNELREEGAVQILYDFDESKRDPILAAVGQLQLEVVTHRLKSEYGVDANLEAMPVSYTHLTLPTKRIV